MRDKDSPERDKTKALIIEVFNQRVKGRAPDLSKLNSAHDGREGDWLTEQMGLTVNGLNEPDFHGFEMKKDSRGKTTFGDWGPDKAIYKGSNKMINRDAFLEIFGAPNPNKNNRYSWSGRIFPTVHDYNYAGQKIEVEDEGINIIYRPKLDSRKNTVPMELKRDMNLATWNHDSLRNKVERKFNQLGWFRCLKDSEGKYERLVFGAPINYEKFLELFIAGLVFIDCGMHQGNSRPYMTWRAANSVWDELAEE